MERSAGILLHRNAGLGREFLLGHLGGPYWAGKDRGAWSIPKGLVDTADHDDWSAACREFVEETGHEVASAKLGAAVDLGVFRQNPRKEIHIWAVPGDLDAATCNSINFTLEWPPKSGCFQDFPEIDRLAWLSYDAAIDRIIPGQQAVIDVLRTLVS